MEYLTKSLGFIPSHSMFDKARAHRQKQGPREKGDDIPLLDTKVVGDFFRSATSGVTSRLPELKERLDPIITKGREKLGDAYSSVAQVLAAQKEAFEDRLAERKNRSNPAPEQKEKS